MYDVCLKGAKIELFEAVGFITLGNSPAALEKIRRGERLLELHDE